MSKLVPIPAVFAVLLFCGCAAPVARPRPEAAKQLYGAVNIFTDPPGVHVYCDGEYWGETGENQPVSRVCWNKGNRGWYNLVLKKRGYKTTNYNLVVRLEHDSREEGERHYQKVVVVMDTE